MSLREKFSADPDTMEIPNAVLKRLESFSMQEWALLMSALREKDQETVAKMFDLTVEQAESAFKVVKEKANFLVEKYPGIMNLAERR
jgi:hypothetical protein